MKNFTKLAIAAALTSPLLLVPARAADKDDRQPKTSESQTQSQPQQSQGPQGQRRRFFDGQPPTADQIHEAEAFAEKYSPNRYHAFKRFAESNVEGAPDRMRYSIVRGFVEMQSLDREDHELYEMKLNEMKLDDEIFGAVAEFRKRAQSGEQVNRADLREQIRPQFKELLAIRRKEAEHRIERMQTALKDEQARLEKLKRVSDEGINARLEQEIESGGVFRPGGFGPSGPARFRDASPPPATSP